MFVSKIECLHPFPVMLIYRVPEFNKIRILSVLNLRNVLYTSKYLNIFNASYVINLFSYGPGLIGQIIQLIFLMKLSSILQRWP